MVDASESITGRLASKVAKMLLEGKRVVVLNAEKSVITGDKHMIITERLTRLTRGSIVNPDYGPFHPRTPEGIMKRTVRGMLPIRRPKGRAAIKNLKVYCGVPSVYAGKPTIDVGVKATKPLALYLTMGELAQRLGWKGA